MPTYEYVCDACSGQVEVQMSLKEKEKTRPKCPLCGSREVHQIFTSFAVGSGRSSGGGRGASAGGHSCGGCSRGTCAGCH